ncbi:MAG: GAF domain-containing protein [Desulfobacterales bacterium]|nr:GAF domain-containing protein [Desulfobacterales bacterium]
MTPVSQHEDIEKQIRDLHEILDITSKMAIEKNLDSLLKIIMEGATRVLNADVGSILLCDYENNEFFSRYIQQEGVSEIRFPLDKGIAGSVARTRQTVNIEDAYQDPRFNPDVDKETDYHTKSMLCMPLITKEGVVIGVTQVLNKKDGVFTKYDERLLRVFSNNAAVSIENTMLYEENERLFRSLVTTLSKTIDARDPVTAGHSQRVALYATRLAHACGLGADALGEMEVAAWLHDIGKIGVRDNVLLKKDQLTDKEYLKLKEHAAYTSEILEQVHFSRNLKNVPFLASAHHERLDGKGYPYGLEHDKLPLPARILAIVDVYDALTAYDRPYKKSMPVAQALSILKKGKGTQFDPELVELFIEEKCYNIECRQHQRVSVDLMFEIVFLSNSEQEKYIEKYGLLMRFDKKSSDVVKNIPEKADAQDLRIRVKDISEGGMQFQTGYFFPLDNFVMLRIEIKTIDLSILCRVVRIQRRPAGTGYIMGVEYVNLKMAERKRLVRYINSLSAREQLTPLRFY